MVNDVTLPRVFFDTNSGNGAGYWMSFKQSVEDLAHIPHLYEGMRVLLYMPEEVEVEAMLTGTSDRRTMVAVPIEGTWRILDKNGA